MGDYGIKVSRTGYSALTAGVLDQVFNTSLNNLKTSIRGSTTSTASGSRSITLTSAQTYKHGFMVFFKVGSGAWFPQGLNEDISGTNGIVDCYVNSSKELIADISTDSSQTVTIKFILFVEPGA